MIECEECGKEVDDTIMGACIECADKILERVEKNVIKKKVYGEY